MFKSNTEKELRDTQLIKIKSQSKLNSKLIIDYGIYN